MFGSLQAKEISLEEQALHYAKGNGKKPHLLRYEQMERVAAKSSKGWEVVMRSGAGRYEFHASSTEERDMWVNAVLAKVAAATAPI